MYFVDVLRRIKAIKSVNGCLLKTIIYNWKYLPLRYAKYLPIVVGKRVKIKGKGRILLSEEIVMPATKMYIGLNALKWAGEWETVISLDGNLVINGEHFFVGSGSAIEISKEASLICGDNFNVTGKTTIICRKKIEFSENCLLSWDTLIMDTDAHTIVSENGEKNVNKRIKFGENTWICAKSNVLSGSELARNTVIGCGSVVKGVCEEENVVLAGNPARVVKRGIDWNNEAPANE
ncbi:MAG: acyltransferase [Sphaerochaeta sp.]